MANLISDQLLARILRVVETVERNEGGRYGPMQGRRSQPVHQVYLGTLTATSTKGSTCTVKLLSGTPGSETVTGTSHTIGAYNWFGEAASGKKAIVANNGYGNYLIMTECT